MGTRARVACARSVVRGGDPGSLSTYLSPSPVREHFFFFQFVVSVPCRRFPDLFPPGWFGGPGTGEVARPTTATGCAPTSGARRCSVVPPSVRGILRWLPALLLCVPLRWTRVALVRFDKVGLHCGHGNAFWWDWIGRLEKQCVGHAIIDFSLTRRAWGGEERGRVHERSTRGGERLVANARGARIVNAPGLCFSLLRLCR